MCAFHFADVFSYDEDDMVEDPNLAQHLAHFGINITQMEKVCDKLCISTNSRLILESNIWSLSHFLIALVKARQLNWFKCLKCRHYFFQFF